MTKKSYKTIFYIFSVLLIVVIFYFSLSGVTYNTVTSTVSVDNFDKYTDSIKIIDEPVKLLFFGDAMFDRYVRKLIASSSCEALFDGVKDEINKSDLTIINLEGAITSNEPVAKPNGSDLRFTFATSTASCLHNVGVDAVSLANNHSFNFGQAGIIETKSLLKASRVEYFGDSFNESDISLIKTINGRRIAIIGYHELYYKNFQNILDKIKEVRENNDADFIIVYAHWGEEYKYNANSMQKKWAHSFIDTGADMVIGAHSHVIEENEIYKNKPIYYSLGNFIFDQYFSEEVQNGMGLEVTINNEGKAEIREIPIRITKTGPVLK